MNILVLAPHPDDETLGCGGTLCRHVDEGDHVRVVFLTSGELGLKQFPREKAWAIREREARKAAEVLRVTVVGFLRGGDWMLGEQVAKMSRELGPMIASARPGLIYLPHPAEEHPDHRASRLILKAALGRLPKLKPRLRGYEVWTPLAHFDVVSDITDVMPRKLKALRAHASQLKEFNYLRAVQGLNQYRGELAGHCAYAEVFATLQ